MRKRNKIRLSAAVLTAVMTVSVLTQSAAAYEPYVTYNYDRWAEAIPSQSGYSADRSVSGDMLGCGAFSEPSDIFRDEDDWFYIADTGNNRIVIINTEFDATIDKSFSEVSGEISKLKFDDDYVEQLKESYVSDMIGFSDSYIKTYQKQLRTAAGWSSGDIESSSKSNITINDLSDEQYEDFKDIVTTSLVSTSLKGPKGVFVTGSCLDENGSFAVENEKCVYIADANNSRVVKCDLDGNVQTVYYTPFNEVYGDGTTFWPQKVLVDSAGYLYVVVTSTTSGAAVFDSQGTFTSFYGANRVDATAEVIFNYIVNSISTETARSRRTKSTAAGFSNFDIDDEGFIYTCTESISQDVDKVKKLNPAGYNIFNNNAGNEYHFGDYESPYYRNNTYATMLTDIDITDDKLICCLDLTKGRVFQYDTECRLLFVLGSDGDQLGTFTKVSAIETMGEDIYVLDSAKLTVTVFKETKFGKLVHEATALYNAGYYEEALEPWLEVMKCDGNYLIAQIGLANAYLNRGDYKLAMKYSEMAAVSYVYNKAFEGWREEFLKENLTLILIIIIVVIILIKVLAKLFKKGILKLPKIKLPKRKEKQPERPRIKPLEAQSDTAEKGDDES